MHNKPIIFVNKLLLEAQGEGGQHLLFLRSQDQHANNLVELGTNGLGLDLEHVDIIEEGELDFEFVEEVWV